jgi:hypothetical protein
MKLLTKSVTFLDVLPNEFFLLKIEIHPDKFDSRNRVLKSVRNFALQKIDIVLLKIKKTVMS